MSENNPIVNNDDEKVDAVLNTNERDVQEELDNLTGYKEYLREQFRMIED